MRFLRDVLFLYREMDLISGLALSVCKQGKPQRENAALADFTLQCDLAVVEVGQLLRDGQAEAGGVVLLSAVVWKYRSKTALWSSGAMPQPVSCTLTQAVSSSARQSTWMLPRREYSGWRW